MKPTVYIETTIASYVTGRLSDNLIVAGRQALTGKWWEDVAPYYDCFTSVVVLDEAEQGDPDAAKKRMEFLSFVPLLNMSEEVYTLADRLVMEHAIPKEYHDDALHVAVAAIHGVDFLLTWNCKHLASAFRRPHTMRVVELAGYACPELCTPEELMER
jgi:hypothetical protein